MKDVITKYEKTNIKCLENINKFLMDLDLQNFSIKALSNFSGPEENYYIHKDNFDVISFQSTGQVEYRIYGDSFPEYDVPVNITDLPYKSYILNEGDVVFIPKGIFHQVVVSMPRITFIADIFDFILT
jgi:ribosomal protein L16 Arg81 hydroxylase